MNTFTDTVAYSNATADIAYVVCIVSFFVAGGVAIYLLWDKINKQQTKTASKARTTRVKSVKKAAPKKSAAPKRAAAKKTAPKKTAVKKPVKRTTKKK